MNCTYQKSSCPQYTDCPSEISNQGFFVQPDTTLPASCQSTPMFNCSSRQIYTQNVQPVHRPAGNINLNKLGVQLQTDSEYFNYVPAGGAAGCPFGWIGSNPKLMDPVRAQKLVLDRPNYTGSVPVGDVEHDEIYTPKIQNYGAGYSSVMDITGGNIQYYIDPSISTPYFDPVYATPATVTYENVMDPMGVMKPVYKRDPHTKYSWNKCKPDACDSFTHDSLEFREELMALQSQKRNQSNWMYRNAY